MVAAYFSVTLAVALAMAATPLTFTPKSPSQDAQLYMLRANCTEEPWHGRHLVKLPSSGRLGLENFTVNPETPPLKFVPMRIQDDDNKYALRGSDEHGDLSRTAYLAALTNVATRTVSLKMVHLPNASGESDETQDNACPEGYACTLDQWIFADPGFVLENPHTHRGLMFGGFKGRWEPFKDAGKEGWHVYWKGNAGIHYPVQLDLIPAMQNNDLAQRRHR